MPKSTDNPKRLFLSSVKMIFSRVENSSLAAKRGSGGHLEAVCLEMVRANDCELLEVHRAKLSPLAQEKRSGRKLKT